MPSSTGSSAPLTKATAWKAFSKLRRRATATPKRNEHYKRFQVVSATILNLHPVPESNEDCPAELEDPQDVEETLRESLDPPATIFGDEFFTSAFYPCSMLDMSPSESRGIIDEFKSSRKLSGMPSSTIAAAPAQVSNLSTQAARNASKVSTTGTAGRPLPFRPNTRK